MEKLTKEQIALLQKPLPKEAIKQHPTKTFLSTIKAIYVVERLNEVFGIGGWFINNEPIVKEGKMIVVKSTFHAEKFGILIPDIFGGNDNVDLGDAYKGACTDALTKIGSYLGIGMDVYKGLVESEKSTEIDNRQWLNDNTKPFDEAIKFLQNGGTIDKIEAKYKLSKQVRDKLLTNAI